MRVEEIRVGDIVDIDYIEKYTKEHINEGKALVIWKGFNHQPLVRKLGTKTTVWACYEHIAKIVGHIDIEDYMDKALEQEPILDTRQRERQLEMEYQHGYDKGWEEGRKSLEQEPNRCDSCIHSEEQDGSNCYECVKGTADNFEAQPKTGYISYISVDLLNKFAKKVAEKALDEITYEGKTIREWIEIIAKQQPSEDCVSRQAVLRLVEQYPSIIGNRCVGLMADIKHLPPVTPTNEDIKEAYLKGYDYGVKDWFKSKTQPSEDCVSREQALLALTGINLPTDSDKLIALFTERIQHLPPVTPQGVTVTDFADKCKECGKIQNELSEEAVSRDDLINAISELTYWHYEDGRLVVGGDGNNTVYKVDDVTRLDHVLPPVQPQPKRGKWIKYEVDIAPHPLHCSICGFSNHHISNRYMREFRRCPNCGAEMSGGKEDERNSN